jgi:hypothetical protein
MAEKWVLSVLHLPLWVVSDRVLVVTVPVAYSYGGPSFHRRIERSHTSSILWTLLNHFDLLGKSWLHKNANSCSCSQANIWKAKSFGIYSLCRLICVSRKPCFPHKHGFWVTLIKGRREYMELKQEETRKHGAALPRRLGLSHRRTCGHSICYWSIYSCYYFISSSLL